MKVLLTGGSGFIGRNIVESYLIEKYDIYFPTSRELNLLDSEAVDRYLQKNKFDIIIHCATWDATADSKKDLDYVLENNLRMYFNITKNISYFNKMYVLGSGAEFCRANWKENMSESYFGKHIPKDVYGFSKYIINNDIQTIGSKVNNLRLFGVYGQHEAKSRFITYCVDQILNNEPIVIYNNRIMDFMYVRDLVPIIDFFINSNVIFNSINICTSQGHYTSDILKIVEEKLDKKTETNITKKKGSCYTGNNSNLKKMMPDFVFTNIKTGINNYIDWYLKHRGDIK